MRFYDAGERNPGQPVARISWVPQQASTIPMANNEYFQKIKDVDKVKAQRRENLMENLNEIFPFYLAKR